MPLVTTSLSAWKIRLRKIVQLIKYSAIFMLAVGVGAIIQSMHRSIVESIPPDPINYSHSRAEDCAIHKALQPELDKITEDRNSFITQANKLAEHDKKVPHSSQYYQIRYNQVAQNLGLIRQLIDSANRMTDSDVKMAALQMANALLAENELLSLTYSFDEQGKPIPLSASDTHNKNTVELENLHKHVDQLVHNADERYAKICTA